MDNSSVYISVLHDSLSRKVEIVREILELTKEQSRILSAQDMDSDRFDDIIDEKGVRIDEMLEIDKGFNVTFERVRDILQNNKEEYRSQIIEMQNFIRVITDMSVELESLEQSNKNKFNEFLHNKRKEIKEFNQSSTTAASYYRNMSNQHQSWQTYFLDKKK